jgi:TRAP-type C4-dicarboxylate transport system permease small subunit
MTMFLSRLDRLLSILESVVIGSLTMIALGLGTMQVVLRYVFNTGFHWSEAAFMLFTVTAMLFAGSRAVRDDKHVRVELLAMALSDRWNQRMNIVSHTASLALCGYFIYCGVLYVLFAHMIDSVSPETGIPDWITYLLVPLTMGLFSVRYIIRIVRAARGEDILMTSRETGAMAVEEAPR